MKEITIAIAILLLTTILLFPSESSERAILSGISNQGRNKNQPYVAAGDRSYIIGTQDGSFPDLGRHVEGEMGGLWLHPIKLMDGFWSQIKDLKSGEVYPLSEAVEFINYPYGNEFKYRVKDLEVDRFQFCPDGRQGMVIHYKLKNPTAGKREVRFVFSVKTDLSPVWFSEKLGIKDSEDHAKWRADQNVFVANDSGNSWFAVWGASTASSTQSTMHVQLPQKTSGKGVAAASSYDLSIAGNSNVTLTFIIAGSPLNEKDAVEAYHSLLKNHTSLLEQKKRQYDSILERANIRIPDKALQNVYTWIKFNNEWLVRDVPGIGRGLSAGLPEYPWWFGTDSTYSLQAVMATGDFDLAKGTLRLLKDVSMKENGNGRIVHEVTTNGVVYNPGNTQETAHFIMCVEKLFRWTGDLAFLKEMYPVMKMGMDWLLRDMDQNKNLFPEGYGIMEVFGLNAELIDVAVYTQQALQSLAYVAGVLNEPDSQKKYEQLSTRLARSINESFWDENEGSYCDFYGTKMQAIRATEGAITQITRDNPGAPGKRDSELIEFYKQLKMQFSKMPDVEKGWLTNKNWVIATPIETGIAPRDRAIRLLDKIRNENVGPHGPYLSAIDRGSMMTIATGVQAVSEYKYGRTDHSLWYVNKIVATFNRVLPGSISEMMPDYGDFTQAWTSYGIVLPLIEHVFGIRPDAINKRVFLEPHLPAGWEDISITNLPVGTNIISFSRFQMEEGIEYTTQSKEDGWSLVLQLKETPGAAYFLDGKPITPGSSGVTMSAKENKLLVKRP